MSVVLTNINHFVVILSIIHDLIIFSRGNWTDICTELIKY